MLDISDIDRIATETAAASLKGIKLSKIHGEPTIDSYGHDALLITIVRSGRKAISGDAALDTLVGIQHALQKAGEDRFAYLQFATEDEMRLNGDP